MQLETYKSRFFIYLATFLLAGVLVLIAFNSAKLASAAAAVSNWVVSTAIVTTTTSDTNINVSTLDNTGIVIHLQMFNAAGAHGSVSSATGNGANLILLGSNDNNSAFGSQGEFAYWAVPTSTGNFAVHFGFSQLQSGGRMEAMVWTGIELTSSPRVSCAATTISNASPLSLFYEQIKGVDAISLGIVFNSNNASSTSALGFKNACDGSGQGACALMWRTPAWPSLGTTTWTFTGTATSNYCYVELQSLLARDKGKATVTNSVVSNLAGSAAVQ